MISTNVQPGAVNTATRKVKDGTTIDVQCPEAVTQYNKYMGGVDISDQIRGYYNIHIKSRKFYKYFFWFVFDVAVMNSFILMSNYTPNSE